MVNRLDRVWSLMSVETSCFRALSQAARQADPGKRLPGAGAPASQFLAFLRAPEQHLLRLAGVGRGTCFVPGLARCSERPSMQIMLNWAGLCMHATRFLTRNKTAHATACQALSNFQVPSCDPF